MLITPVSDRGFYVRGEEEEIIISARGVLLGTLCLFQRVHNRGEAQVQLRKLVELYRASLTWHMLRKDLNEQ